jgi:hypothetical protein
LQGTIGCGSSSHFYDLPNSGGTGNVTSVSNIWNSNADCNSATPSSLLCQAAAIEIEGPGIAAQTIAVPFPGNRILPIDLLSFNTATQKNKVKISWATAFESNSNFFTVERAADAENWVAIATVKGAGTTTARTSYESYDEKPLEGKSYYRLKQTGADGKVNYSDTKSVLYSNGDNIFAYPVPNSGNTVNFTGILQPQNIRLSLHDAAGNTVYTTMLSQNKADLPQIKPGMYTISLFNTVSGITSNLKYVKL